MMGWTTDPKLERLQAIAERSPTLRDQFAMAALSGLLANPETHWRNIDDAGKEAYIFADSAMEAREK